jgi:hypothetical protein
LRGDVSRDAQDSAKGAALAPPRLMTDPSDLPEESYHAPIAWAAFLGTSWTWCIGMFLPVLLVRDAGSWGWLVFAIPNVVGAAAMGWILKSPEQSRQLVESHPAACRAFSIVTIAFHVFFVLWFVPRLVGLPAAAVTFAITAIYLLFTISRGDYDVSVGIVVWLISLGAFARFGYRGPAIVPHFTALPSANALYLLPVCLFGFAMCPYLDLTFHRARQALPEPADSRTAFGIGFGVCFFLMIIFSLCYSRVLGLLVTENWHDSMRQSWGRIIAVHMIVQTAYTISVHTRSFIETRPKSGSILSLLFVCQFALLAAFASVGLPRITGLDAGEIIYRAFMGFYGLVFPVYVWMFILLRRVLSPRGVRAFILTIVIALPMYFGGFVLNKLVWLVPGVLVALVGGILLRSSRHDALRTDAPGSLPEASNS